MFMIFCGILGCKDIATIVLFTLYLDLISSAFFLVVLLLFHILFRCWLDSYIRVRSLTVMHIAGMQRGNRMPSRRGFFQDLHNKLGADQIETTSIHGDASVENANIIGMPK